MAMEELNGTFSANASGLSGTLSENIIRGLSAYQIAVKHGFVGTEEEWLESLKGKQIELREENSVLQWRYEGDEEWNDLIDLSSLVDDMIAEGVADHIDEAIEDADLYDIVDELPENPTGNHMYMIVEDDGNGT